MSIPSSLVNEVTSKPFSLNDKISYLKPSCCLPERVKSTEVDVGSISGGPRFLIGLVGNHGFFVALSVRCNLNE